MSSNNTNQLLTGTEQHKTSELHHHGDGSKLTFTTKIRQNKEYRVKFLYTVLIWSVFLVFGWKVAQIGPSLLDLQIIAKTTLDKISAIFTSDAIGYLGGTFLSGFLFRKFNSAILLLTSAVGSALMIAAIPWCSVFEAMVAVFAFKGVFDALLDTVSNAELFRIWKTDNAMIVQTLHFFFTVGAALSPTVTAPFLMTSSRDYTPNTSLPCTVFDETIASSNASMEMGNCSFLNVEEDMPSDQHIPVIESRLYVAYLITSSMYVLPCIFFFFSCFKINKEFFQRSITKQTESNLVEKPSFREKLPILIIVASLSITYVVVEASLLGFLSAFFVEQLNWTKQTASYLTSVFWTTFALGRFSSIFLLKYITSSKLLAITTTLLFIASIGLLTSSLYIFNPGLWISIGLCGLAMSSMFPTIFTWTDSEIIPVTGFITSLIFAAGASTAIINPVILGYLMDNVNKMAFCYFILGGTISFVIVFIIGLIIAKRFRLTYKKAVDIDVTVEENINITEISSP